MTTAVPHPFALQAAAALARRGFTVFPIPPWGRVPAPGWHQNTTADPHAVPALFEEGANIGVACHPSRLVVLDLDRHDGDDGIAAWSWLCARHRQNEPATFTIRTPHSGRHLYFRAPDGATIASSSGRRSGLPPGIDVRAPGTRTGAYVLGPGSHIEAGRYRIAHDLPVAPLPVWLHHILKDPEQP